MPFCAETGERPDIIINPHAIPSRMTIGQLLEAFLGIVCCLKGRRGDGTPFGRVSIEQIGDELEAEGFQRYGNRCLVNGQTGERMPGLMLLAPTYYQRLKHMVIDKVHGRARGPMQVLTRQPVEGRSREGGLRFGEMERDCLISHGASAVLVERLCHSSDPFKATICADCGLLAQPPTHNAVIANKEGACKVCGGKNVISKQMPYAYKLLLQELYTMQIAPRLCIEAPSRSERTSFNEVAVDVQD